MEASMSEAQGFAHPEPQLNRTALGSARASAKHRSSDKKKSLAATNV
jgi:hypothetical protein